VGGLVLATGLALGLCAGVAIVRVSRPEQAQASPAPVAKPEVKVKVKPVPVAAAPVPDAPVGEPMAADLVGESRLRGEHAVVAAVAVARPAPKQDVLAIAGAHYKRGTELFLAGDFTGSEVAYRAALTAVPGYTIAYKALGILYQRRGDAARALESYRRYLALAPKAPDADSVRERISQLGGE
jgi:tetratricopeptide (TPR) repeat protein